MFYRVFNEAGTVVVGSIPDKDNPSKTLPLNEVTAIEAAQRQAQLSPGKKFYVSRAYKEVVVELPAAKITDVTG